MVKISILMPVYNAEEFLNKAIESVIAQTFSEWELICVDDESSDESLRILEEYSKLDDRIKIFTQKNTGPLGARRLGFEHSKGEYIIYLDADDYFSPDLLMSLYNKAIESNADAIAPDMIGGEQSWNKKNNVDINEELSGMQGFLETFPWRKLHNFNLWKRRIFQESTYHPYLEGNSFNADEILQRIMLLNCNKIVFSPQGEYVHTINLKSITHVLSKRSFYRLSANDKLIQLGRDYHLNQDQMNRIYGFAFFCQLKSLMIDFYKQKNHNFDKKWALKLMKDAFDKYTQKDIKFFYGTTFKARIKAQIQIYNFYFFKFVCYLQAKLK